eukprot:1139987-Pelagomonas_calceolata.AAC.2
MPFKDGVHNTRREALNMPCSARHKDNWRLRVHRRACDLLRAWLSTPPAGKCALTTPGGLCTRVMLTAAMDHIAPERFTHAMDHASCVWLASAMEHVSYVRLVSASGHVARSLWWGGHTVCATMWPLFLN